jgi:tRNA 2-thiouridine synthesizing protein E
MPVTTIEGHEIHVDDEGFMTVYEEWDEGLGAALAGAIGVDMTDDAWNAIRFMRKDFKEQDDVTPTLRRVSTAGGFETKKLFELFPKKPAKKMAYIAGLPKPKGCV